MRDDKWTRKYPMMGISCFDEPSIQWAAFSAEHTKSRYTYRKDSLKRLMRTRAIPTQPMNLAFVHQTK